jgi:hypothetical protein
MKVPTSPFKLIRTAQQVYSCYGEADVIIFTFMKPCTEDNRRYKMDDLAPKLMKDVASYDMLRLGARSL